MTPTAADNTDITPPSSSRSFPQQKLSLPHANQEDEDEDDDDFAQDGSKNNKSKRPGRRAKSRMTETTSTSSTTATSTRAGFSPHKIYLFFFVMVFSAIFSIYQSSSSSPSMGETDWLSQQPLISPELGKNQNEDVDQSSRKITEQDENKESEVFSTSVGDKETDEADGGESAEAIRLKYKMAVEEANSVLGKKKAEESAEDVQVKYLLALQDANKVLGKKQPQPPQQNGNNLQQQPKVKAQQPKQRATKRQPVEGGDEPVKIEKPLNIVILYADDWRHDGK